MPSRPGVLPFLLVLCLASARPAAAQDEFLVNDDRVNKNQWAPTIACGSSGSLVVIWMDGRNTFNSNVDFDAYALTIQDPQGIGSSLNRRINDDATGTNQNFPDIAASPSGTFFCVWEDTRAANGDIYGAALDSVGFRVTPNLRLNDDTGTTNQSNAAVTAVGSDRYLVVWGDQREKQGEIYGVYVTAAGAPIGPNFKITNDQVTGGSFQGNPALAAMPDGTVLVAWVDGREGGSVIGATADVYAQRVNALGQLVGGNFKINGTTGTQNDESVCVAAGPSGFVVGWIDRRSSPADPADVYAQRIDPSGGTVGANVRVNDDPSGKNQRAVRAFTVPGSAYLIWEDYRGNLGIDGNVEMAMVPFDATPPGVNLRVNASVPARQGTPDAVWDGRDGIVAVWEDARNGSPDVYALSILPDGTRRNSETQLNDDAAPGDQRHPHLGRGPGVFLATWIDMRSGTADLYGQWITAAGGRSGANHLISKDDGVNRPVTGSAAVTAAGPALVAAQIARDSDAGEIRGFLYTVTGNPPAAGFWISDLLASAQSSPAVATDGASFGAAWLDARTGIPEPFGQKLTLTGARVGVNHPILTPEPAAPVAAIDLEADPAGGYWLAYAFDGAAPSLWIAHLDTGLTQDRAPLEVGAGMAGERSDPHLGVGPDGRVEVVWVGSTPAGLTFVYLQTFDATGAILTSPIRMDPDHDVPMLAPTITVSGKQSVVAWEAKKDGNWSPWIQAYEGGVAPKSALLRADQDVLGADQLDPVAGLDASGRLVVLWSDDRSVSSGADIVGRAFSFTPTSVNDWPDPPPTPEPPPAPNAFRIGPASPNPFSGALAIPVERPGAPGARLRVRVVNARGERVATLYDGPMPAERAIVRWDGRDARSRQAGSGVYWIVAESGGERRAVRVVQLR